ncbi:TPA: hypothetical protein ACXJM1_004644, partial [Serratia marcescens]
NKAITIPVFTRRQNWPESCFIFLRINAVRQHDALPAATRDLCGAIARKSARTTPSRHKRRF